MPLSASESPPAVELTGVWQLSDSSNFDEFLKAAGVSYMKRKLALGLKPVQSWERKGDVWQFTVQAPWGLKVEAVPIGVTLHCGPLVVISECV